MFIKNNKSQILQWTSGILLFLLIACVIWQITTGQTQYSTDSLEKQDLRVIQSEIKTPDKEIAQTPAAKIHQEKQFETISIIKATDFSKILANATLHQELNITGTIKVQNTGDSLTSVKRYYLYDDHNNIIQIDGIDKNILGKLILFPTIQRFEVLGKYSNFSQPKITAYSIIPKSHESQSITLQNSSNNILEFKRKYCNYNYTIDDGTKCDCNKNEIFYYGICTDFNNLNTIRRTFNFIFNTTKYNITLQLFGGLRDTYRITDLNATDSESWYEDHVNSKAQEKILDEIISKFALISNNKDNQARMAISFVQKIPYDFPGFLYGGLTNKYPYEVLYDNLGVCGDKSFLLIALLKRLGYSTAYIVFDEENHAAVGISCESLYQYRNTGFCFIESTIPAITSDSYGTYNLNDNSELTSSPKVFEMSKGISFNATQDFNDELELTRLENIAKRNGNTFTDPDEWYEYLRITRKYGLRD